MASASLLSPPPLKTPIPADSSSRKNLHANYNGAWAAEGRNRRRRPRRLMVIVRNSSGDGEVEEKEKPAFNPFGFVTDNPSSRSAIQLPESPAEDGNVGQMLYRIEDKGKEYGSYVKSGKLRWFVRETGLSDSRRGNIIFIHGAPTQSYSYRVVMSQPLVEKQDNINCNQLPYMIFIVRVFSHKISQLLSTTQSGERSTKLSDQVSISNCLTGSVLYDLVPNS